jgi:hypothetical protein
MKKIWLRLGAWRLLEDDGLWQDGAAPSCRNTIQPEIPRHWLLPLICLKRLGASPKRQELSVNDVAKSTPSYEVPSAAKGARHRQAATSQKDPLV